MTHWNTNNATRSSRPISNILIGLKKDLEDEMEAYRSKTAMAKRDRRSNNFLIQFTGSFQIP